MIMIMIMIMITAEGGERIGGGGEE